MEATAFAQGYPHTLTTAEIHRGAHAPYMYDAQEYSYKWGQVLHMALGNVALEPFRTQDEFQGYYHWLAEDLDRVQERLSVAPDDIATHGLNELNFHLLNRHMAFLWEPLLGGAWQSEASRNRTINQAQTQLALVGLRQYMDRERFIEAQGGTHALFEPRYLDRHNAYTGMLQEIDAAIVLLDVVRDHPNLTVVPAPLQFERSWRQVNVDFVVADLVDHRAVGIQVKSRVRFNDVERADAERVIFLDGDIDLNDVRLVQKARGRSVQPTAWPGIIAAKRVDTIPERQLWARTSRVQDIPVPPQLRKLAHQLVGSVRVDHEELANRIGDRIMQKL